MRVCLGNFDAATFYAVSASLPTNNVGGDGDVCGGSGHFKKNKAYDTLRARDCGQKPLKGVHESKT